MSSHHEKFSNYYELLGIDPAASPEEVRQAYLEKVKEWHPDINPERVSEAEEMTKVLNQAYQILGDSEGRKKYDRMLKYTRGKNFDEFINDDAIRSKMNKAYPALKKILGNVRELYGLFKDSVKGNYKLHPANIAMIGGGLLYFILPADLIPDFLPLFGYLDDLAVLTTIMNSLKGELNQYRDWRKIGSRGEFTKES